MTEPDAEELRYGIEAWLRGDLFLDKYRYAPGPAEDLPKHVVRAAGDEKVRGPGDPLSVLRDYAPG